ncbi:uncharacterized protein LACBIDRAFT_294669 [Laccaria bicolor S238N-H82]|uniref:Predicted protein n=1 Tax=Laccaria bicolor (strain S238N-H82 / ATCC MYA-4686) TaxID=486041 RepID=B0DG82_LACBS|nr:uncharacterized protein LACBIDRAFT_294669 [Laccaria bicolor S238N-H82]EDR06598.1 predicted protein [Laccaria bicolor S238N-H82]|eukprot:XP_001882970.1 predicted protein [Laccaria bicolor S238N-H82]
MSTAPPRWVVVDDADSTIAYTGAWSNVASKSLDTLGNFGPTYLGTSHGTNSTASFAYSFQGSAVNVFGTTNINNSSGVIDPTWECFIDGVSIGSTSPFQYAENNWALCTWNNNGASGSHVLTVNATSNGHPFYFDWLQYEPPQSASVQNAVVYLGNLDAAIKYDSSWQSRGNTANMTTKGESKVTVDFIGTQLSWYGFIPSALPHNPSLGTYAIDGQTTPTEFTLKGLASSSSDAMYNTQFFQTPKLSSSGPHELVVTFLGDSSSTPLTVTYILIQNGSLSVSAPYTPSSSSGSSPSKSTSSPSSSSTGMTTPPYTSHVSTGAIAGSILGVLVLILLCLLFVLCFLKRRHPLALPSTPEETVVIEPFRIPFSPPQDTEYTSCLHNAGYPQIQTRTPLQSYDLPNSAAISSGRPPPNVTVPRRLAQHQPRPLVYPPRKRMDSEAASSIVPATPTPQMSASPSEPPMPNGRSRSRVVLHQDSGIRLRRDSEEQEEVAEVPPLYTPG